MTPDSLIIFLISLGIVSYSIKRIIYISHKKHLFDEPSEDRKNHTSRIPNLGGVAIYFSVILVSGLFLPITKIQHLNYIFIASVILFLLGLTDDLIGVPPFKKLFAQFAAALTLTLPANCRITSLYGIMGFYELPYTISIILSALFIILVINSFNLVDGINCLAGSIGLLACLSFAFYFYKMQETGMLLLALAMSGSLAGFLLFNRTPARIFMGDTGSFFIGYFIAFLSLKFIELNQSDALEIFSTKQKAPALVLGLLIIPFFDTFRIFLLRILKKTSPFRADRNHIHHRLIDLGFSHFQATGILLLVTVISLVLAYVFAPLNITLIVLIISATAVILNAVLSFVYRVKTKRNLRQMANHSYHRPRQRILIRENTVLK